MPHHSTLTDATLTRQALASDVARTVMDYGIAVLPSFLDSKAVERLRIEFDDLLTSGADDLGFQRIVRDEGTTVPVVRNLLDDERYPQTLSTFTSDFMREVSQDYLRTDDIGLNHQIYVNRNAGTDAAVGRLPFLPHFDKISTLKVFIYLTDTCAENGAMGVGVGSHHANRQLRQSRVEAGQHVPDDNIVQGAAMESVDGPAGTMFIFDTDATHAAGFVRRGQERLIMRGHTRTRENLKAIGLESQI